jgi:hypothetical protein
MVSKCRHDRANLNEALVVGDDHEPFGNPSFIDFDADTEPEGKASDRQEPTSAIRHASVYSCPCPPPAHGHPYLIREIPPQQLHDDEHKKKTGSHGVQ